MGNKDIHKYLLPNRSPVAIYLQAELQGPDLSLTKPPSLAKLHESPSESSSTELHNAAPTPDQPANQPFTDMQWMKELDNTLVQVILSKTDRNPTEMQKGIFSHINCNRETFYRRIRDLKQNRPELQDMPKKEVYIWTPERCARLIRARLSEEDAHKTWTQLGEEHFPGSPRNSFAIQWVKMKRERSDLLTVKLDDAVRSYINQDETDGSEKEGAEEAGAVRSTSNSEGNG